MSAHDGMEIRAVTSTIETTADQAPWTRRRVRRRAPGPGRALPPPPPVPRPHERRRALPRGAPALGRRTATTTRSSSRSRTPRSSRTAPSATIRREWIQRILDHDGDEDGRRRDRVVAPARRGARRRPRGDRAASGSCSRACATPSTPTSPSAAHEAVDRGGRLVAHRAVRPGRDQGPARGDGAALPVDRPGRPRLLPLPAPPGAARRRSTRSASSSSAAARASSRSGRRRAHLQVDMLWAQLEAIDRGDTRPRAHA